MGLYGKHPAKGDFLEAGLPPALLSLIEAWLDTTLADLRETLGPEWKATWDRAPLLRFWLGEGIWGGPLAGVMTPSQDKVGRRFPLLILDAGAAAPAPPVCNPDQTWYDAAAAHLALCLARKDFDSPAALLDAAPHPGTPEGVAAASAADFWAVQPGNDPAQLWADVTETDHRRAAAGRSYWWVCGEASQPEMPPAEISDGAEPAEPPPDAAAADPVPEPMVEAPQSAYWDLPPLADVEEDGGSPFDADTPALGLFAAPLAPLETDDPAPTPLPAQSGPEMRAPLWSQVWAGNGLPSGAVLAWFFRGHVGND